MSLWELAEGMGHQSGKFHSWAGLMRKQGFRVTLEYAETQGRPATWTAIAYAGANDGSIWSGTKFSTFGFTQMEAERNLLKIILAFIEANTVV